MGKKKRNKSSRVEKPTPPVVCVATSPSLSAQPSPAQEAVFATRELFDDILLRLPIELILTAAQRVSKTWQCRIESSRPLQRHLFLLPDTSKTLKETGGDCTMNPLLYKHFGPMLGRTEVQGGGTSSADSQPRVSRHGTGYTTIKAMQDMHLSIADMSGGRARHKRFACAGATWRRMLVSQPPPRSVGYVEYAENGQSQRYGDAPLDVVTIPDGLRMGVLWDTIYRTLWSPYGKDVERRLAFVSWRIPRDLDSGEENTDMWTSGALPVRLRSRNVEVEMIVGHGEAIVDEQQCHLYHNHSIKGGKYKCRDEYHRFVHGRTRASTSWVFRSEDYNEERTLAKIDVDCKRERY
ncbi:unnamed protein product [Clonostachys byssicola]|uniref:F-box domain-containing protein n=1 Tax=Clonostachys byssicola TaxID=160290 RepID=A0A9N9XXQ9_9HYPO|nr:unnamed protein product [Clonostachys byssicola]